MMYFTNFLQYEYSMKQIILFAWLVSATNTLRRVNSFTTFLYSHKFDTF